MNRYIEKETERRQTEQIRKFSIPLVGISDSKPLETGDRNAQKQHQGGDTDR